LTTALLALLDQTRSAFSQDRVFEHAKALAVAQLLCLGRHTISGMLTTCGQQFTDWSAAYRLFSHERVDCDRLYDLARTTAVDLLEPAHPVVALLDDTLLHKSGRHVHGTAWKRDPLGPRFSTNFIWAQRFLQLSVAVPESLPTVPGRARAIPIDMVHCPTPRKPSKKATAEERQHYALATRTQRISVKAAERIIRLRDALDHDPGNARRPLILCVDASYTNRTVFSQLPDRTTVIGRVRKDAALWELPVPANTKEGHRGRRRSYGNPLPTPEQIRLDESIPWKTIRAFAAGRTFDFKIKSVGPVRWRPAGGERNLRLIVIEPLAYRPHAKAKMLYRQPAYLLCSDTELDEQQLLQYYLWRWEIELNFREEKTLLGAAEAQVRTPAACETVPAFKAAVYAYLLLAEQAVSRNLVDLPAPRWQRRVPDREARRSTAKTISLLRSECWAAALGLETFSGFKEQARPNTKPEKIENTLKDAVLYAMN
jgi:hypothetical protein